MGRVIVVGLGPGGAELLTVQARDLLQGDLPIYLRTSRHPAVQELGLASRAESFDGVYEAANSFDEVYHRIVERLLQAVSMAPSVVYAVPGHPLFGERPTRLLLERAASGVVDVTVVPGLSFVDAVVAVLGIDPLEGGLQIVDGLELAYRDDLEDFDPLPLPVAGLVAPYRPLLVAQMYSQEVASLVKVALGELYPDTWPVKLIKYDVWLAEQRLVELPLSEIDRGPAVDHLTTLFVPALAPLEATKTFESLAYVIWRLRGPGGCPWDREQTSHTIKSYLVEETYEALEALETEDWEGFVEELGDVLLQVVLHSQIGSEEDLFDITAVLQRVSEKLIRRHPHVFGTAHASSASEVLRSWEALKAQERQGAPKPLVEGIPAGMPALAYANELLRRAQKLGFEWPSKAEAMAKVKEELAELEAATGGDLREELGDLLLALVKLAQWLRVDPEEALRLANRKFTDRLRRLVEALSAESTSLGDAPAERVRELWEQIKSS